MLIKGRIVNKIDNDKEIYSTLENIEAERFLSIYDMERKFNKALLLHMRR